MVSFFCCFLVFGYWLQTTVTKNVRLYFTRCAFKLHNCVCRVGATTGPPFDRSTTPSLGSHSYIGQKARVVLLLLTAPTPLRASRYQSTFIHLRTPRLIFLFCFVSFFFFCFWFIVHRPLKFKCWIRGFVNICSIKVELRSGVEELLVCRWEKMFPPKQGWVRLTNNQSRCSGLSMLIYLLGLDFCP